MSAVGELIKIYLRLAFRDRAVIFFNYLFPLVFFFIFAEWLDADQGGTTTFVVSMVLVLGILGNGLFGAGMRAVQDREANILRRFKVAPITPTPILIASVVTGWIIFLPAVVLTFSLAYFFYDMPLPERWFGLLVFISLGLASFRALGLILASVANSMQESNLLIQSLYMPMLFLSGATFPLTLLPDWAQIAAQYLPASYLVTGFQGTMLRNESLWENLASVVALLVTMVLALFISRQIFRWEKEEKLPTKAKAWVLAVLLPFLLLGTWQAYSRDQIDRAKTLWRDMRRGESVLIRNARIFVGDGTVIENGGLLVRQGKIARIYDRDVPEAEEVRAELIEGAGKTVVPGLIDVHVHLGAPGGFLEDPSEYDVEAAMQRALISHLYSGVTAVRSLGDLTAPSQRLKARVEDGEVLAAQLVLAGPLFTAPGGHGTEYFEQVPEFVRGQLEAQFVRTPSTAEEAARQVLQLQQAGVGAIKIVLDAGVAGMLFNRLDPAMLEAVSAEALRLGLPVAVHTADLRDIEEALGAGASSIEHGSARQEIPPELLERMAASGAAYDPTLAVVEAIQEMRAGRAALLDRSLVQQVGERDLIDYTRARIESGELRERLEPAVAYRLETAAANLLAVHGAGGRLVAGSDAGNALVLHGPGLHRELQLWVAAGVPAADALRAATHDAARLLGMGDRVGLIREGFDADLLLVDGNPLEEIQATERISTLIFKGERVRRSDLFDQ